MKDYITKYKQLCFQLNDGTSKKDIKKHNQAMKSLGELYHQLEKVEDKDFVLELLNDKNIKMSSLVAAHCLGWGDHVDEAKKVLKRNARDKGHPIDAFDAQMTLDVYREQGYLEF